jgi:hypothetical protein
MVTRLNTFGSLSRVDVNAEEHKEDNRSSDKKGKQRSVEILFTTLLSLMGLPQACGRT